MKHGLFICCLLLSLVGCTPGPSLNGTWVSDQYRCPNNVLHSERINVIEKNNQIVARKIDGDECVLAGEITFEGTADQLTCHGGRPGHPSSMTWRSSLALTETGFTACEKEFYRPAP